MNDSKNNPKSFPPDDFSATTPNIKMPKHELPDYSSEPANDWEKTNYNYSPKDLGTDQWSKPAYNTPPQPQNPPTNYNSPYPPSQPPQDFNKTYMPGNQPPASNQPKEVDWGMTQANIKLPSNQPVDQTQTRQGNYGGGQQQPEYGATTPLIRLPENERQKYQNLPPTPTQAAEEKQDENKGGIPGWIWAAGGMFALFLFAVVIIAGVYFLFFNKSGFDVVVRGAPDTTRQIRVNGSPWDVTTGDGNYKLTSLKAGETKKIEIDAPGWTCESFDVTGGNGVQIERTALCKQTEKAVVQPTIQPGCDPSTFTKNDIAKSHACAYEKLNALKDPFTVQDLLAAMNLYIINFASGKYNINPEDMKFLEKSAGYMKKLPPEIKVEVGGHTDNTGKDNQKLSENRANAVRDALIGFGVNKDALTMQGYAERNPVDTNATDDGKFRNRRIAYRQG